MTDKTKIIVSGVDQTGVVVVEAEAGCNEIRASFKAFPKSTGTFFFIHSRASARLVIATLRKCADEIERVMNVLPEKQNE